MVLDSTMDRFFAASPAPASSSAEQPATLHARRSAEQPASSTSPSGSSAASSSVMRSIQGVDRWQRADGDASRKPPVQHLKGALKVLMTKLAPRQQAARPLCTPWQVQQVKGKDVELPQLREQLQQKVIEAANKIAVRLGAKQAWYHSQC